MTDEVKILDLSPQEKEERWLKVEIKLEGNYSLNDTSWSELLGYQKEHRETTNTTKLFKLEEDLLT